MRHQFLIAVVASLIACGHERKTATDGSGEEAPTSFEVRPSSALLTPGGPQQFSLAPTTVQVSWKVTEANGGTINSTGLYTAPGFSGVFHVVATSTANPAASAQAIVTVDSGVRIAATSPVNAFACEQTALTATVTGSGDTAVIWSVPGDCGTITTSGAFTSLRGSGTCVVTAQAHADVTQAAAITVNVAPERVLSVAVLPAAATVGPGGARMFAANVTTACGTFPAGG